MTHAFFPVHVRGRAIAAHTVHVVSINTAAKGLDLLLAGRWRLVVVRCHIPGPWTVGLAAFSFPKRNCSWKPVILHHQSQRLVTPSFLSFYKQWTIVSTAVPFTWTHTPLHLPQQSVHLYRYGGLLSTNFPYKAENCVFSTTNSGYFQKHESYSVHKTQENRKNKNKTKPGSRSFFEAVLLPSQPPPGKAESIDKFLSY